MKQFTNRLSALLFVPAVAALASACTVEEPVDAQLGEQQALLCDNRAGVNAVMTGLAVAAGNEFRRWVPTRDMQWNTKTDRLEISPTGGARCPNRVCANTQALLALQNAPANTVRFPGGEVLDPVKLRAALKTNWNEQVKCVANGTCKDQAPDLDQSHWEYGSCDVKYFFDAYKQGTTTRITDTATLSALKDNLIYLGYPENKMLNFYIRDGQVSVDPTGGLNEGGTTTTGSCTLACSRFSKTDASGACCSCDGVKKKFKRSTFSSAMYLCQ